MNPGLPIRSEPAVRTLCLKLVSGWVGAGLFCLAMAAPAAAVEMDELMDNVLDSVREETRQSIRQQVKQETQEVVTEEQVIPSTVLDGFYTGFTIGVDQEALQCTLTFSGTGSGTFSGTCTLFENDGTTETDQVSGTFSGSSFTVKVIEEIDFDCPAGTNIGTGSGTITGQGEPGTVLSGTVSPTCGDTVPESFTLTKA